MLTDGQKSKAEELKPAIAASALVTAARSPEVRAAALVLKDELRRVAPTARVLARALGIHETALCRCQHAAVTTCKLSVSAKRD